MFNVRFVLHLKEKKELIPWAYMYTVMQIYYIKLIRASIIAGVTYISTVLVILLIDNWADFETLQNVAKRQKIFLHV